ncbi:MAG: SPOR domain-containing protein [Novosphingobium sp.]|nr:SPOR domain-containing protein [Novosphingobium sp.]
MRFQDNRRNARILPLALTVALAACGSGGKENLTSAPVSPYGPAADYPVVIGDPFTIDGVTYTPSDTLNVDEVGYAGADAGEGVSAALRTVPLPSYAEVTSLETGRTILVRVERRGPMDTAHVIGLSPAAMEQLGANVGTPVRVRRVNPPEQERAALRRGESAPLRMDTPMSLVDVLKRKLPQTAVAPALSAESGMATAPEPQQGNDSKVAQASAAPSGPIAFNPAPSLVATAETESSTTAPASEIEPPEPSAIPTAEAPKPASVKGGYVVQAGAYSTEDRAQKVSSAIGGYVEKLRTLWRVRTGPFGTQSEAKASLAKVTGKGYSGARIYRID